MPANKFAVLRYRIIDRCLRNKFKPYPSLEELRSACSEALYGDGADRVSLSTIEKDLRDMRENPVLGFHAPIAYDRARRGYYYAETDFSIDRIPLNQQEVKALQFAAETLYHFREAGLFSVFSSAVEKIFEQLHILSDINDPGLEEVVQFESIPSAQGMEWIRPFYDAIRQLDELILQHRKFGTDAPSTMVFHPYLLKEFRNRWYVVGWSTSRKRIISLGLDRVLGMNLTGDTFERSASFNPSEFFRFSYGITEAGLSPEKVILSFVPTQSPYLISQPVHHSQKVLRDDENEFRISLEVRLTYELKQLILGYGPDVKVLAPDSLRSEISDLHHKASRL